MFRFRDSLRRTGSSTRHRSAVGRARPFSRFETLEKRELLVGDINVGGEHSHEQHDNYAPPLRTLYEYGDTLSPPAQGDPLEIAMSFLRSNAGALGLEVRDFDNYLVSNQYQSPGNGVTHIYLQQTYNQLPVANANTNINLLSTGEVLNVGTSFVSNLYSSGVPTPSINVGVAFQSLAADFEWDLTGHPPTTITPPAAGDRSRSTVLSGAGVSREDIPVKLQYVPVPAGGVELAWQYNVQPVSGGTHWYDLSVSAVDGEVLDVIDWAAHASYNVFAAPVEAPTFGNRSILVDPHLVTASPYGWHDTNGAAGPEFTTTQGNNVYAYVDRDADDAPDAGMTPDGGASLVFDFPLDQTQEPDNYRSAAATNLFYANNFIHDALYQFGFNEAAGNFQFNNHGNGGLGNDHVFAEAQDGADICFAGFCIFRNNANMQVPPDGINPRMQMYLWDLATPELDGDFDNGIIYHEYGHGVSIRLTAGPANSGGLNALQSGGMGEGWSDIFALTLTQAVGDSANERRGIGTFAFAEPTNGSGIRSLPYSYDLIANDHTYASITGLTGVHSIGEIWATTLWDLNWALIDGSALDPALPNPGLGFDPDWTGGYQPGGSGNQLFMQLMLDGMKLQPALPTMLDARDAILAADQALTGGQNEGTIWTVFARRGMGFSADDGGNANSTQVTEAFDLPPLSHIRGTKFQDKNQNGTREIGEGGLAGWTIYLDANDNAQLDATERSTVTNSFGQYSFSINPGNYVVREVAQPRWTQVSPGGDGAHRITLPGGSATIGNIDFGNFPDPGQLHGLVWSDLNQNAIRDNGESGLGSITLFLDDDGDGLFTLGEPTAVSGNDGSYLFPTVFVGQQTVRQMLPQGMTQTFPLGGAGHTFTVAPGELITGKNFGNYYVPATIAGFVWNDVNSSGSRDTGERGMANIRVYLDLNNDGRVNLSEPSENTNSIGRYEFKVPPGIYNVRVAPMLGFTQSYPADNAGYEITILRDEVVANNDFGLRGFVADFGDAPSPYPTTFTNAGAAHEIKPGPRLGTLISSDLNGQPSNGATADNDDGVTLPASFNAGEMATIRVAASSQGYLTGWIDLNRDGFWDPVAERVIADVQVNAGTSEFMVDVPTTTVAGLSYARFRISTVSGLLPTGVAPDGEVEDYAVTLVNNIPDPDLPGSGTGGTTPLTTPASYTNPSNRYDVDADGNVLLSDALSIVTALRNGGARELPPITIANQPPPYVDVNGDNRLNISDALEVVRAIIQGNAASAGEGEASVGAAAVAKSSSSTTGVAKNVAVVIAADEDAEAANHDQALLAESVCHPVFSGSVAVDANDDLEESVDLIAADIAAGV